MGGKRTLVNVYSRWKAVLLARPFAQEANKLHVEAFKPVLEAQCLTLSNSEVIRYASEGDRPVTTRAKDVCVRCPARFPRPLELFVRKRLARLRGRACRQSQRDHCCKTHFHRPYIA